MIVALALFALGALLGCGAQRFDRTHEIVVFKVTRLLRFWITFRTLCSALHVGPATLQVARPFLLLLPV